MAKKEKESAKKSITTENYLVIGCAYAGIDQRILKLLNAVAKRYNCSVIHAGPLTERKDYEKARNNLGTMGEFFVKEVELVKEVASCFNKIEFLLPHISSIGFFHEMLKNDAKLSPEERLDSLINTLASLYNMNPEDDDEFDILSSIATNIIEVYDLPKNVVLDVRYYRLLSKYIAISSVQPKSEIATRVAPSHRLLDEYKKYCSNWILPYPTPEVTHKPKLGLNKTYNYFYTGSLYTSPDLDASNQYYKTDHLPSAVLVIVDKENGGHFHPRHIDIEVTPSGVFIVDDGLLFKPDGSVTELSTDDRGSWSTDDHAPFTHPGTLAALCMTNELHQPSIFINGGDAGEILSVHRHNRKNKQRKELEGKRVINDVLNIQKLLETQTACKSIKKRIKLDANHEGWLDLYISEHPELDGIADWKTLHKRFFSNWEFIFNEGGDNQVTYFGDILCRHGHQETLLQGARISDHHKYLCGHHHSYRKFKRAVQTGCGASLGAAYLNNSATAWQSQIATLSKHKGIASVAPKIVLHYDDRKVSRFAYRDKIYEVDWIILPGFLHDHSDHR